MNIRLSLQDYHDMIQGWRTSERVVSPGCGLLHQSEWEHS